MKVLLTGDSIIARYEGRNEPFLNYELKKRLPKIKLLNTAVSGINSGAFFARLSELVLTRPKQDVLVILLGTNDLAKHKQVPLEQFRRNMELIASAVVCQYWPKYVILVSPPAVDEKKQLVRSNELVREYGQVVKEVSEEYHFHFVDLGQKMMEKGDLENLCHGLKNDGLHFGKDGYEFLSDLLSQVLTEIE